LSPTLPPLPPPGQPAVVKQMNDGEVLVEGTLPVQDAKLLLLNHDTDEIRGQFVHDGSYSVLMPARTGDRLDLWYSVGGVDSPVYGFNVPEGEEPQGAPEPAADASSPE
jgi:hypothetical protein